MTSLFPPVLENPGIAFPSSTWGGNLEISFLVPDINNISEIKHVQVIIKYRSNNTPALDTKYLPDRMTLFLTRDQTSHNVIYDAETSQMRIIIPYKYFDKGYPKENTEYSIQVRFGNGAMWDGYRDFTTNFTNFAAWRKEQISKVPSGFGEWSNSQTRYCYGSISTGFDYNLDDFVPEIVFNFNTEEDNPDTLRQCQIEYTYGSITKTKILDGIIDEDGNGSVRFKIPVAPIGASPIKVHLKAVTTYNVILEDDLSILSLVGSSIKKEDKLITNEKVHFEELVLKGPELEDGCIAKKLVYNDGVSTLNNIGVAIYRINCYTLETIKVADFDSRFLDIYNYRLKDFSVEMGEEYQYVAVAKNLKTGKASSIISALYPFGEQNSGYGRVMRFDATYLCDKNHQLRLQGNVSVSSFKRNTTDNFQTTIGSEYPFYSRTTANNYRTFQISSLVTINTDPTATFLMNEPVNGLIWQDDNEKRLMILNRDLYSNEQISLSRRRRVKDGNGADIVEYGKEEPNNVIETDCDTKYEDRYHQDIQSLLGTSLTDNVVFAERKFREQVMKWLSDGKPKLFRSETEGNMIVMLSGVSFSPFEKSGRAVYTMSATCTEIAECDMNNLIDYNLMPMDISTQVLGQLTSNVRPGEIVGDAVRNVVVYMAEDLKDNFQEYSNTTFRVKEDANIVKINQILESITKYSYIPGDIQYPIGREWEYRNIETGIVGDSFPALRLYDSMDWEVDENIDTFDDFWLKNGESKKINLIPDWLFTIKKEHKSSVIEKLNFEFLPTANLPKGLAIETEKIESVNPEVGYEDIKVWLYINDYEAASKSRPGVMSILKITDSGRPEATQYVPIYFGPVFDKLQFVSLNNHILNNAFVGDEVNFDIINKIKGGVPFYDENGESYYSIESQNLPSNLILQDGKIQGNIADIYTNNENEFWISIKDSFGHYTDQKITYGPVYGIVRANVDEVNLGILYQGDNVRINLTQYVDNIANGIWQVNGTEIETPEVWKIPTNDISSEKQIYTIKYKNNIALDFDDKRGAASFNIVVDQVVAQLEFTTRSDFDIKPKVSGDDMIPLGEELHPINIYDGVTGGVPPYTFVEIGGFKPDYSLSRSGIISGKAKEGRLGNTYGLFKVIDSNQRVYEAIPKDTDDDPESIEDYSHCIRIYPIQNEMTYSGDGIYYFNGADIDSEYRIDNNAWKIAGTDVLIKINLSDFSGGFLPYDIQFDDVLQSKLQISFDDQNNLILIYPQNVDFITKNYDATVYVVDNKGNKVAITLKIPRIYTKLKYSPAISSGDYSVLTLNMHLNQYSENNFMNLKDKTGEPVSIIGGIPPYTLKPLIPTPSGFDSMPSFIKIYQGEGAEQNANNFIVGGTPSDLDISTASRNVILSLVDSIGQTLNNIKLVIPPIKSSIDYTILTDIKEFSNSEFVFDISGPVSGTYFSLVQFYRLGSQPLIGYVDTNKLLNTGLEFQWNDEYVQYFRRESASLIGLNKNEYNKNLGGGIEIQKAFGIKEADESNFTYPITEVIKSPKIVEIPEALNTITFSDYFENETIPTTRIFKEGIGLEQYAHKNLKFEFSRDKISWTPIEDGQVFDNTTNIVFNYNGTIYSPGLGATDHAIIYYIRPKILQVPIFDNTGAAPYLPKISYQDYVPSNDDSTHIAEIILNSVPSKSSFYLMATDSNNNTENSINLDYGIVGPKSFTEGPSDTPGWNWTKWDGKIPLIGDISINGEDEYQYLNWTKIQLTGLNYLDFENSNFETSESQKSKWLLRKDIDSVTGKLIGLSLVRQTGEEDQDSEEVNFVVTLRNIEGKEAMIQIRFTGVYPPKTDLNIDNNIGETWTESETDKHGINTHHKLDVVSFKESFVDKISGGSGLYILHLRHGSEDIKVYSDLFKTHNLNYPVTIPNQESENNDISNVHVFVEDKIWNATRSSSANLTVKALLDPLLIREINYNDQSFKDKIQDRTIVFKSYSADNYYNSMSLQVPSLGGIYFPASWDSLRASEIECAFDKTNGDFDMQFLGKGVFEIMTPRALTISGNYQTRSQEVFCTYTGNDPLITKECKIIVSYIDIVDPFVSNLADFYDTAHSSSSWTALTEDNITMLTSSLQSIQSGQWYFSTINTLTNNFNDKFENIIGVNPKIHNVQNVTFIPQTLILITTSIFFEDEWIPIYPDEKKHAIVVCTNEGLTIRGNKIPNEYIVNQQVSLKFEIYYEFYKPDSIHNHYLYPVSRETIYLNIQGGNS